MAGIRSRSSATCDRGVLPLSPSFSPPPSFSQGAGSGIQAPVTTAVTPGPGAAAGSGNLTIPAPLEYFGAAGTGESPLPAVHHPYVCPYIYPCLLSRPRVRRFVASPQLGSRCYSHLLPLPASRERRLWEWLQQERRGSLRFQRFGRRKDAQRWCKSPGRAINAKIPRFGSAGAGVRVGRSHLPSTRVQAARGQRCHLLPPPTLHLRA